MNKYLMVQWKTKGRPRLNPNEISQFLQSEPEGQSHWQSTEHRLEIHSFVYWPGLVANPSYLLSGADRVLTFDGIPLNSTLGAGHEARTHEILFQALEGASMDRAEALLDSLHGEFSLLYFDGRRMQIRSNLGGSHPIFYAVTEDFIALTNRMALLFALPGMSRELDIRAASWMCYQGQILEDRTAFQAIRRIPPGSRTVLTPEGGLTITPPRYGDIIDEAKSEEFEANPVGCLAGLAERILDYMWGVGEFYRELPFSLPLSGGRDSRLVLSLLHKAGMVPRIGEIYTNGPHYSPDVLSAKLVTETVGFSPHVINQPAIMASADPYSAREVATIVHLTDGLISLYDAASFPRLQPYIRIAGSQDVLHDNYFVDCDQHDLGRFLEEIFHNHFHDPVKLLRSGVREQVMQAYGDIFRAYHGEGTPVGDLGYLYMLRQRNANWTGVMYNYLRLGGPTCNPLLHGDIYRTFFSLPLKAKHAEALHFLIMHLCCPELTALPFANIRWRDDLQGLLKEFARVPLVAPFRSHAAFPSLSNPFLSNRRIESYNAIKPYMKYLLDKHNAFFEQYLDGQQVRALLSHGHASPQLAEVICMKGLFTTILLKEFGPNLLNRVRFEEVVAEMETHYLRPVKAAPAGPEAQPIDKEKVYQQLLESHSKAIGTLVRDLQKHEPVVKMDQGQRAIPWRHVLLINEGDRPFRARLEHRQQDQWSPTTPQTIKPHSMFPWGVRWEEGEVQVKLLEDGQDLVLTRFRLEPTIRIYPVVVPPSRAMPGTTLPSP